MLFSGLEERIVRPGTHGRGITKMHPCFLKCGVHTCTVPARRRQRCRQSCIQSASRTPGRLYVAPGFFCTQATI